MKKFIAIAMLLLAPLTAKAQNIFWWDYPMNVGSLTTNINQSFSNLLSFVQGAFSNQVVVRPVQSSSNWVYWVSNSTDGATAYWNATLTNGSGSAFTGLLYGVASDAAWLVVSNGFGASGLGTATFHPTNTPLFGTFGITGTFTAVASSSNYVRWVSNGVNQTLAYFDYCMSNSAAAGGGSQSPVTGNIAYAGFTFSNASQGEIVQVPTTNHVQAAGRISFFDDRRRVNPNDTSGTQPIIPHVSLVVDATNSATWVGVTVHQSNGVPSMIVSGIEGPSSAYQPGFAFSTAGRAIGYNSANATVRSSPGKTAGDEDLLLAILRGIDEADIRLFTVPGTASDTVNTTAPGLLFITYVEGGTGRFSWNPSKQDVDFVVSGQNTGQVLKVDGATDAVAINQPGLYYAGTAVTGAALRVYGSIAINSDDTAHTNHSYKLPGGDRLFGDGTNLFYRNNAGTVNQITAN